MRKVKSCEATAAQGYGKRRLAKPWLRRTTENVVLRSHGCARERKVKSCEVWGAHRCRIVGLAKRLARTATECEALRRRARARERKARLCEATAAQGHGKRRLAKRRAHRTTKSEAVRSARCARVQNRWSCEGLVRTETESLAMRSDRIAWGAKAMPCISMQRMRQRNSPAHPLLCPRFLARTLPCLTPVRQHESRIRPQRTAMREAPIRLPTRTPPTNGDAHGVNTPHPAQTPPTGHARWSATQGCVRSARSSSHTCQLRCERLPHGRVCARTQSAPRHSHSPPQ